MGTQGENIDTSLKYHTTCYMLLKNFPSLLLFLSAFEPHNGANAQLSTNRAPAQGRWIDTWVSMPQLTEPGNLPPAPFVSSSPWSRLHYLYSIPLRIRPRPHPSSPILPFDRPSARLLEATKFAFAFPMPLV